MTDRQGIEIDYCPKCRGVWLDRGELDKIIERSGSAPPLESNHAPRRESRPYPPERRYDDDDDDYRRKHRKKRGGLLWELFDFD
jgi:hypothetical protein